MRELDDQLDCIAAAKVRRGYLRQLTTGQLKLTDPMRAAIAAHVALLATTSEAPFGFPDPSLLAGWLGVDVIAGGGAERNEFAIEAALRATIRSLADPHQALLAALAVHNEDRLDGPPHWTPARLHRSTGRDHDVLGDLAWLGLVGGPLGYRWTPWEAARLEAAGISP